MGDLWDAIVDFYYNIRNKVRGFFGAIFLWLAVRWKRNAIWGIIATIPFALLEMGFLGFGNDLMDTLFSIAFILGIVLISLASTGFFIWIIRKIILWVKYR